MKILYCSFEASPFFKMGGLGDVAGSLPLALAKVGISVTLILPGYKFLKLPNKSESLGSFIVDFNRKQEKVFLHKMPVIRGVSLYILYHPFLSQFNHQEKGVAQYTFFSKAIAETLSLNPNIYGKFDLVHLNDWHTASVAYFLSFFNKQSRLPCILTIHNMLYQGSLDKEKLAALIGSEIKDKDYQALLGLGIRFSDYVTTVSPTYAKEIIKTRKGMNLRELLYEKRDKITGILNGIDVQKWDPQFDEMITSKYNLTNVTEGKTVNKLALQKEFKLMTNPFSVLVSFIGRLEPRQKGIDLIIKMLKELIGERNFQLVILGTGHPVWAKRIRKFVEMHPKNISFINRFDEKLSHRIYASSDLILIPSKYEPCGLVQMIAMRYGTLPLVRLTGGLVDTVKEGINGFTFKEYSATALARTLRLALKMFKENPGKIAKMRETAMKEDFSWDKSAKEYQKLYRKVIKEKKKAS